MKNEGTPLLVKYNLRNYSFLTKKIFENGNKQMLAKRRHVQGMLDETDPLTLSYFISSDPVCYLAYFSVVLKMEQASKTLF